MGVEIFDVLWKDWTGGGGRVGRCVPFVSTVSHLKMSVSKEDVGAAPRFDAVVSMPVKSRASILSVRLRLSTHSSVSHS